MRALTVVATLSLLIFSHAAFAQESATTRRQVLETSPSRPYSAEESATLSRTAREKAEALEQARDRKMRSISKGICNGC
jgi:hypothetical protein